MFAACEDLVLFFVVFHSKLNLFEVLTEDVTLDCREL